MRIRLLLPVLTSTMLLGFSVGGTQAGSFFGPSCYGQEYAYQYPNRAHIHFGCGPGGHCTARHPLFKHRLFHRHQNVPTEQMTCSGMPMNGMPMNGVPVQGMQANGMQMDFLPTQALQSPMQATPVHMTSIATAPFQAMPAVQSRATQIPSPLPAGPANTEPARRDSSGKPPF